MIYVLKNFMFKHARPRTNTDSKYWNHKKIQYRVASINPKNHNSTKSSAIIAATQIRKILKDVADFGLIYNKCTFTSATISLNLELGTDVHAAFSLLDTMFRYSSTIQDEIKNLYIDVLFDDNNTNAGHYTVSIWDAGEYVTSISIYLNIIEDANCYAKLNVFWGYYKRLPYEKDHDFTIHKKLNNANDALLRNLNQLIFTYPDYEMYRVKSDTSVSHLSHDMQLVSLDADQHFTIVPLAKQNMLTRFHLIDTNERFS